MSRPVFHSFGLHFSVVFKPKPGHDIVHGQNELNNNLMIELFFSIFFTEFLVMFQLIQHFDEKENELKTRSYVKKQFNVTTLSNVALGA